MTLPVGTEWVYTNTTADFDSSAGKFTGTDAGTYQVVLVLSDPDSMWSDGTTGSQTIEFIIEQAPLIIDVKDKTATVGGIAPDLSEDDYIFLKGPVTNDLGRITVALSYENLNMNQAGSYEIQATVSGDRAGNYNFICAPGTLTVSDSAYVHTPTHVVGQAATCTADGWKDYYKCSDTDCAKLFSDPACTSEITLDAWKSGDGKIAKLGHKAVNIPEQSATTSADGVKTYWYCPICNKYFKEAACTNEITDLAAWKIGDGKIAKLSEEHVHTPTHVAGQAATCTADGWKEYYKCSDTDCAKLFSDPACTSEITLDAWKSGDGKIAKLGHKAVNIPEQSATTSADGVKTYWYCPICNKYFKEAACTNEITDLAAWKIGDGKIARLTSALTLSHIEVTASPTKVAYTAGENFAKDGILSRYFRYPCKSRKREDGNQYGLHL